MTTTEPDEAARRRPLATFRLTRSVAAQWAVVSAIGFFGFLYCFGHVLAAIRGTSLEPVVIGVSTPPDALWSIAGLALLALVVVPHELLHGAFLARYGGSPSYGVGVSHFVLPYAYAETRDASYTRNQLLVVLLAPFTVITAVGLLMLVFYPSPPLLVPLAANGAGSIGDLWMAAVLCQYPADVRVTAPPDGETQGFAIYGSSDATRSSGRLPGIEPLSAFATGAVATLALLGVALIGLVFNSLAFGSGTVIVGGSEGWLLFRHELLSDGSVLLEIGEWLFVAVVTAGGAVWVLLASMWRSLG